MAFFFSKFTLPGQVPLWHTTQKIFAVQFVRTFSVLVNIIKQHPGSTFNVVFKIID